MRSKVHPKYKTKYRVGNWSAYEQALVQRGDVTLCLSADATDAWRPSPSGRPGAPKKFSDCVIETALTLRLVFRLPLRQAAVLWVLVLTVVISCGGIIVNALRQSFTSLRPYLPQIELNETALVASVDTQNRQLIDASKPAIS